MWITPIGSCGHVDRSDKTSDEFALDDDEVDDGVLEDEDKADHEDHVADGAEELPAHQQAQAGSTQHSAAASGQLPTTLVPAAGEVGATGLPQPGAGWGTAGGGPMGEWGDGVTPDACNASLSTWCWHTVQMMPLRIHNLNTKYNIHHYVLDLRSLPAGRQQAAAPLAPGQGIYC
jgi:hypothetical protein